MSKITVEMPSGTMKIKQSECIGAFYAVTCHSLNERFICNCIDATPEDRPKRMRIQHSVTHGGKVLQPHDYTILEKDPQWPE